MACGFKSHSPHDEAVDYQPPFVYNITCTQRWRNGRRARFRSVCRRRREGSNPFLCIILLKCFSLWWEAFFFYHRLSYPDTKNKHYGIFRQHARYFTDFLICASTHIANLFLFSQNTVLYRNKKLKFLKFMIALSGFL